MKIYIVRHGETLGNKKGLFQGTLDTPLSDFGIELAEITGEGLKDIKFDAVYASPLKRAYNTAEIIMDKNNYKTNIIKEDRIREINMGTWEGVCFKDKDCGLDPKMVELFATNPFKMGGFPKGETVLEVCQRSQEFLKELVKKDYQNVLIATHGFATRAILNFMYDDKTDFWQGRVPYNCAVNIIEYKDGKFSFIAKDKIYYDKDKAIDHYKL